MSISVDLVEIAVMTPEGNFERRYIGQGNPRHERVCGNDPDKYTAMNTRLLGYYTGCQNRRAREQEQAREPEGRDRETRYPDRDASGLYGWVARAA